MVHVHKTGHRPLKPDPKKRSLINAPDAEPDVLPQEKTKGILEAKTVYKKAKHEIFRTKRKKQKIKKLR